MYSLLKISIPKFLEFSRMQDFDFPQIVYHYSLFGYLVSHHWTSCVEPKFNWIEWHAIIIVFGFSCQKSIVSWEWGMWSNIFFIKTGSPQPNVIRWSKGFCCNEKCGSFVFIHFKHFSLYALTEVCVIDNCLSEWNYLK